MPRGSSAYLILRVDPSTGEATLFATNERDVKYLETCERVVVSSYASTDEGDPYLEAENLLFERYDEGAYDFYRFEAEFLKTDRPQSLGELRREGRPKIDRRKRSDSCSDEDAINVL